MIWIFYNLLFPLAFLLLLPKFLSRMLRRGGYKKHFEQRFGIYGEGLRARLADTQHLWIHAVSVGEIKIALRFMQEYRVNHPTAQFVLSTNTSTAHTLGETAMDPRDVLIYFPLDFPFVMKRAFDRIRPVKLILVECEFWPNLIRQAHRRGIPVSLINGRISDSSFRGYLKLRPLIRRLLEMMDPICVQGRQDAERMLALGARRETVKPLGTVKYDLPAPTAQASAVAREALAACSLPSNALVLLGGSTWSGEEAALCRLYKKVKAKIPHLFLVLVPRHAERREEVMKTLQEQNLSVVLRSQMQRALSPPDVLLVDTTGELMSFYAAADLVFVGKSLCAHGGQNPIEPALFGNAIVVGPNMENFPSVMDDFLSADALCQITDFKALAQTAEQLLCDDAARSQLGAAAQQVVAARRGVVSKTVDAVG